MANRRSLTAAMELSPDKLAFVRGAAEPSLVVSDPVLSPQQPDAAQPEDKNATPDTDLQSTNGSRSISRSSLRTKRVLLEHDDAIVWISNPLVPLTTRLQPDTAAALKRAGLEQKLCGRKPGTVQEIVEAALRSWLQSSGFLQ